MWLRLAAVLKEAGAVPCRTGDAEASWPDRKGVGGPPVYGEPRCTFEDWRRQQAFSMWSRARLDWCSRYGWPGGLDYVELLRETVALRLAGFNRD